MSLTVPYVKELEKPLKPLDSITVIGKLHGDKFVINFAVGPNLPPTPQDGAGGDEIACHLSFRKDHNTFATNSWNGSWQNEEAVGAGGIKNGFDFNIVIEASEDHFKIYVNNSYTGDIQYRAPLDKLTHVQVLGNIELESVERVFGEAEPEPKPEPEPEPKPEPEPEPKPEPEPTPAPAPATLSPTPYVLPLPGHFGPGHKLRIIGIPDANALRFHVNLYVGFLNAFHYQPRFDDQSLKRDSRKEGEDWDKQTETDNKLQGFPYEPAKQFELLYSCENDGFEVYVDGAHHFTFKHRLPPNEINLVGIEGDIKLNDVKFE